jgi:hypothetical protein
MQEGKLFRMETDCGADGGPAFGDERKSVRRIEFFWLCSNCAAKMTVVYQKGTGVSVQRLDSKVQSAVA